MSFASFTLGLDIDIDIDRCINEAPEFYPTGTYSLPRRVVVITYRRECAKAIADVEERNTCYDEVFRWIG
ncbi:MAG TPA: hypothetical protein DDZ51_21425 [Planctomycetaceae bacterium]|nr:hypothetical protein [Planctomycetaceae bacterium]